MEASAPLAGDGMANKQKEYDRGFANGLDFAMRLVEEGGPQALKDQIRIRGIVGSPVPWKAKDLDEMFQNVKIATSASVRVGILSVLHDEFGFGEKRLQKFNDAFDKLFDYMSHGWVQWMDIVDDLKETVPLAVGNDTEWFSNTLKYNRPEEKDIYTQDDFICPEDWSQLLQDLGYTDYQDPITPTKHYIRTGDGSQLLWEYDGQYQQVHWYDFLDGIRYAVQAWGLADEKEGET